MGPSDLKQYFQAGMKPLATHFEQLIDYVQGSYDRLRENFLPALSAAYTLGSATIKWLDLFVINVNASTVNTTGSVIAKNMVNADLLVYTGNEDIVFNFWLGNIRKIVLTDSIRLDFELFTRVGNYKLIVVQDDTGGHGVVIQDGVYVTGDLELAAKSVNILDITATGTDVYIVISQGLVRV